MLRTCDTKNSGMSMWKRRDFMTLEVIRCNVLCMFVCMYLSMCACTSSMLFIGLFVVLQLIHTGHDFYVNDSIR